MGRLRGCLRMVMKHRSIVLVGVPRGELDRVVLEVPAADVLSNDFGVSTLLFLEFF